MPLCSLIIELSPTVRARSAIIVFLRSWLIRHCTSTTSIVRSSTLNTPCCSHCLSELFRLTLPFRLSSSHLHWLILSSKLLLRCLEFSPYFFTSFCLHQYLFMFVGHDTVSLAVELFSLLLKHFLADLGMLRVCLRIERSSAAWALIQIHAIRRLISILSNITSKVSSLFFGNCWNNLLRNFIIIIRMALSRHSCSAYSSFRRICRHCFSFRNLRFVRR